MTSYISMNSISLFHFESHLLVQSFSPTGKHHQFYLTLIRSTLFIIVPCYTEVSEELPAETFISVMNGLTSTFDGNLKEMMKFYRHFGSEFWNHLITVLTLIKGGYKKTFKDNKITDSKYVILQMYQLYSS